MFDPDKVAIYFDDVQMVRDGVGLGAKAAKRHAPRFSGKTASP